MSYLNIQFDYSKVKCRVEVGDITVPTWFGSSHKKLLTCVIITDQPRWMHEEAELVKRAEKILQDYRKYCKKELGWGKIETQCSFRTTPEDERQPRPNMYWDVKFKP